MIMVFFEQLIHFIDPHHSGFFEQLIQSIDPHDYAFFEQLAPCWVTYHNHTGIRNCPITQFMSHDIPRQYNGDQRSLVKILVDIDLEVF